VIIEYVREVMRPAAVVLLLALGGCQTAVPAVVAPVAVAEERPAWERLIHPDHALRLETIEEVWARSLGAARAGGFARRIRGEGPLLDPGAGLAWTVPSPGSYRCRRFRLGPQGRGLTISGTFFCHLGEEGEQLSLTQQTGPERPGGYLWQDNGRRMVFIGAVSRGREDVPPAYGEVPGRDVVGVFERVGPFRYRLALPREQNVLDVIELVPALPPA
jgi:hypothetical protein